MDELEKLFYEIDLRFQSGNIIDCEKSVIPKSEWDAYKIARQNQKPYGWIEPSTGNFCWDNDKETLPFDAATFTMPLFDQPKTSENFDRLANGKLQYQVWTDKAGNRYCVARCELGIPKFVRLN